MSLADKVEPDPHWYICALVCGERCKRLRSRLTRLPRRKLPAAVGKRRYAHAMTEIVVQGLPVVEAPHEAPRGHVDLDDELHETAPWQPPPPRSGCVNADRYDLRQGAWSQ